MILPPEEKVYLPQAHGGKIAYFVNKVCIFCKR